MERINLYDMVNLIFYCICILFCTVMLGFLIASIIIYFNTGVFRFEWGNAFFSALKKSCTGGSILGIGIWIKGKLRELKFKNNSGGE